MKLRPYQATDVLNLLERRKTKQALVFVAPTGSGKTVVACELANRELEQGGTVAVLCPRRELVHQTCSKLDKFGIDYGTIMANDTRMNLYARVQVASIPTLHSRLKRHRLPLPMASLVIVDEAHLSLAPTTLSILQDYVCQGSRIIGLTATPARMSGLGMGNLYDELVSSTDVKELTRLNYLVPVRYYAPAVPDLSGVRTDSRTRDYRPKELSHRMNRPKLVGDVIEHWLRLGADRRTVVFCVDVAHSIAMEEAFCKHGVAAIHIDARTPVAERERSFDLFRRGRFQVLCNCNLATYGFDLPALSCVVMARPTKSLVLYLQMIGRGMRPAAGKEDCLVLDHAGNVYEHGFVDDEFPWSLDMRSRLDQRVRQGKSKREAEPRLLSCPDCGTEFRNSLMCPGCGYTLRRKGRMIMTAEGELVELEANRGTPEIPAVSEAVRQIQYQEFLGIADEKGYKKGWASYAFREMFNDWPPRDWTSLHPKTPTLKTRRYAKYMRIKAAKAADKAAAA